MPFYKRLTDVAHKKGVRVVGVSTEDLGVHRNFLDRNGLYIDGVVSVITNKIQVRGTPTLVVVNRKGVVLSSWEGAVGPTKESDVEAALIPNG